eukprot:scaffold74408_cov34-Attheya_sp.AAC.2
MAPRKSSSSRIKGPYPKRAKVEMRLQTAGEDDVLVFCLTQDDKPVCCLALANHALQGYCVTPSLVRHIHAEFLTPVSDEDSDVWDAEQGYEIQSIMASLFSVVRFEPDDDQLFPGSSMLVPTEQDQLNGGIPNLISSGWMSGTEQKDFDMYVVSVPVVQEQIHLVHMFALKAFFKAGEATKTWVVLDVVPGFVPFIVQNIEESLINKETVSAHLIHAFDQVHFLDASVIGIKGDYAHRSFDLNSALQIGLPYNVTPMAGAPFVYRVYKLEDLQTSQSTVLASPVDLGL